MSKVIINILDKFVWMLVITVITTQALQIVGVVEGPTKLDEISYPAPHEYEFKIMSEDSREKRQTQERLELYDNIFNIPIATLNSVNELLQSTRRLRLKNLENRRRQQEQLQQQQQQQIQQIQQQQQQQIQQQQQQQQEQQDPIRRPSNKRPRYNAHVQADGSSSRVLLNI